jgi:hypothetical protein
MSDDQEFVSISEEETAKDTDFFQGVMPTGSELDEERSTFRQDELTLAELNMANRYLQDCNEELKQSILNKNAETAAYERGVLESFAKSTFSTFGGVTQAGVSNLSTQSALLSREENEGLPKFTSMESAHLIAVSEECEDYLARPSHVRRLHTFVAKPIRNALALKLGFTKAADLTALYDTEAGDRQFLVDLARVLGVIKRDFHKTAETFTMTPSTVVSAAKVEVASSDYTVAMTSKYKHTVLVSRRKRWSVSFSCAPSKTYSMTRRRNPT